MPNSVQPRYPWLVRMRLWHRWIGVGASFFMLLFALTGIVLNYKRPILGALGLLPQTAHTPPGESTRSSSRGETPPWPPPTALQAGSLMHELPVSFEAALALAEQHWGRTPLERVELKLEQGQWRWKVKQAGGAEMVIDAYSGHTATRGRYEKWGPVNAHGQPTPSTDWGKILLDLHTGRIAGAWGKAIMTAAAGLLVFLTLSGLYLWCKPLLLHRSRRQPQAPASDPGVHPPAEALITGRDTSQAYNQVSPPLGRAGFRPEAGT